MSGLSFRLDGADRLEVRLVGLIERLEDLEIPLLDAAMLERDLAVERIKIGGDPPWPPSKKTLPQTIAAGSPGTWAASVGIERGDSIGLGGYGQTGIDEGTMLRALDDPGAVRMETPNTASVGINVRTADGKYNYAQIFQQGSGVYAGHSAWTVTAQPGGVLAWQLGGTWFYAASVTHQGQPPRPFLYFEGTEDKVVAIFSDWLGQALREAS